MDKMMSFVQLVMAVLVFIGISVWGICHICMGNLRGFGLFVICIFLGIAWKLILLTRAEYLQERNK